MGVKLAGMVVSFLLVFCSFIMYLRKKYTLFIFFFLLCFVSLLQDEDSGAGYLVQPVGQTGEDAVGSEDEVEEEAVEEDEEVEDDDDVTPALSAHLKRKRDDANEDDDDGEDDDIVEPSKSSKHH